MYLGLSMLALCLASCKTEVKVDETTTTNDTTKVVTTEEAPEVKLDSVAEQKAWEAYMTPGKAHKMMADETGTWTCDMTFWHEEGEPMKATYTAVNKMIMGGRYQQTNYTGNMMGMSFEGQGTMSFDNSTKEYTSTWIDNMGTGMMVMKGKMEEGSNSLELKGDMVDPAYNKVRPCREVYTIVDENTRKMEMFCTKGGKESKTMEIVMKRK